MTQTSSSLVLGFDEFLTRYGNAYGQIAPFNSHQP